MTHLLAFLRHLDGRDGGRRRCRTGRLDIALVVLGHADAAVFGVIVNVIRMGMALMVLQSVDMLVLFRTVWFGALEQYRRRGRRSIARGWHGGRNRFGLFDGGRLRGLVVAGATLPFRGRIGTWGHEGCGRGWGCGWTDRCR